MREIPPRPLHNLIMAKSSQRAAGPKAPAAAEERPGFDRLPTMRLSVLHALMSREGELVCQREIGLRISECRILGVVGFLGTATLKQTSIEIGLDKGQTSRLVAGMEAAGLLERHADADDQRSFHLALTPAGRETHDRVARLAAQRNQAWLSALTAAERETFLRCLDTLTAQARRMLDAEGRASGVTPALPLHQQGTAPPPEARPLLVQRQVLTGLRDQLNALLGEAMAGPGA